MRDAFIIVPVIMKMRMMVILVTISNIAVISRTKVKIMRLIDADQFGVISLQGKSEDFIEGAKFILEKIDEAPTIERLGEWVEKPSYKEDKELGIDKQVVCSRCDEQNSHYVYGKDGRIEGKMYIRSNFCPNCGADMRRGSEEE